MRECIFIILISVSTLGFAQTTTAEQREVQQTVTRIFEALSARDAVGLKELCTVDVRFNEYGQPWTIDTLINRAITKITDTDFKRTNTLDFISTRISGDVAWTTYYLHSSITRNAKQTEVYWMETVVLVREEKKWKVSVLHSTRMEKK